MTLDDRVAAEAMRLRQIGLTQRQVADNLGIDVKTVGRLEAAKAPKEVLDDEERRRRRSEQRRKRARQTAKNFDPNSGQRILEKVLRPKGRVCAGKLAFTGEGVGGLSECLTVLSVYNKGTRCASCERTWILGGNFRLSDFDSPE